MTDASGPISRIENAILRGLVLDDAGQWVPIEVKRAADDAILARLASGQVVRNGQWVTIAQARNTLEQPASASAQRQQLTDVTNSPIEFPPETAAFMPGEETEISGVYPPETSAFSVDRNDASGENDTGFAQETSLFKIERDDGVENDKGAGVQ